MKIFDKMKEKKRQNDIVKQYVKTGQFLKLIEDVTEGRLDLADLPCARTASEIAGYYYDNAVENYLRAEQERETVTIGGDISRLRRYRNVYNAQDEKIQMEKLGALDSQAYLKKHAKDQPVEREEISGFDAIVAQMDAKEERMDFEILITDGEFGPLLEVSDFPNVCFRDPELARIAVDKIIAVKGKDYWGKIVAHMSELSARKYSPDYANGHREVMKMVHDDSYHSQ